MTVLRTPMRMSVARVRSWASSRRITWQKMSFQSFPEKRKTRYNYECCLFHCCLCFCCRLQPLLFILHNYFATITIVFFTTINICCLYYNCCCKNWHLKVVQCTLTCFTKQNNLGCSSFDDKKWQVRLWCNLQGKTYHTDINFAIILILTLQLNNRGIYFVVALW